MERAEHLQWCKDRALAYVDQGDHQNAMNSMLSDLGKHSETEKSCELCFLLGMATVGRNDDAEMRKFINGFN